MLFILKLESANTGWTGKDRGEVFGGGGGGPQGLAIAGRHPNVPTLIGLGNITGELGGGGSGFSHGFAITARRTNVPTLAGRGQIGG